MTKEELERIELLEAQANNLHNHNAQLRDSVKQLADQNRKFQEMVTKDMISNLTNLRIIADVLWPPDPDKSTKENISRKCSPENSLLTYMSGTIEILIAHALRCDPPLVDGTKSTRELQDMIRQNQKRRNDKS